MMKVESVFIFLVFFTALCQCDEAIEQQGIEPEPPEPKEPIEDENVKIARELYHAALQMLNSSTPNRHKAWDTMTKAADLGSPDAQVRVAFAKLAGIYFPQGPDEAKEVFVRLAEQGHPQVEFNIVTESFSAKAKSLHFKHEKLLICILYMILGTFLHTRMVS